MAHCCEYDKDPAKDELAFAVKQLGETKPAVPPPKEAPPPPNSMPGVEALLAEANDIELACPEEQPLRAMLDAARAWQSAARIALEEPHLITPLSIEQTLPDAETAATSNAVAAAAEARATPRRGPTTPAGAGTAAEARWLAGAGLQAPLARLRQQQCGRGGVAHRAAALQVAAGRAVSCRSSW